MPFVTMRFALNPPTLTLQLFLDFTVFSFKLSPQNCDLLGPCGNLTDHWYPPQNA